MVMVGASGGGGGGGGEELGSFSEAGMEAIVNAGAYREGAWGGVCEKGEENGGEERKGEREERGGQEGGRRG